MSRCCGIGYVGCVGHYKGTHPRLRDGRGDHATVQGDVLGHSVPVSWLVKAGQHEGQPREELSRLLRLRTGRWLPQRDDSSPEQLLLLLWLLSRGWGWGGLSAALLGSVWRRRASMWRMRQRTASLLTRLPITFITPARTRC